AASRLRSRTSGQRRSAASRLRSAVSNPRLACRRLACPHPRRVVWAAEEPVASEAAEDRAPVVAVTGGAKPSRLNTSIIGVRLGEGWVRRSAAPQLLEREGFAFGAGELDAEQLRDRRGDVKVHDQPEVHALADAAPSGDEDGV